MGGLGGICHNFELDGLQGREASSTRVNLSTLYSIIHFASFKGLNLFAVIPETKSHFLTVEDFIASKHSCECVKVDIQYLEQLLHAVALV